MDIRTKLRHDYRKTWEAFSRHTSHLHTLTGTSDPQALQTAMRDAAAALAAHQEARDRLAIALAPSLASRPSWTARRLFAEVENQPATRHKVQLPTG